MAKIPVPPTRRRRSDSVRRIGGDTRSEAAGVRRAQVAPPVPRTRANASRPGSGAGGGPDIGAFARDVSRNFGRGVAQTGAAFGEMGNRVGSMLPGAKPNQISTAIKTGQQGNNPLQKQLKKP